MSHIKQVPGWNERLASDSEAVVKAEHDVRGWGGAVGGSLGLKCCGNVMPRATQAKCMGMAIE